MANPVGRPRKTPPVSEAELALITKERLHELELQAKEEVDKERRLAAEMAFIEQEKARLKKELNLDPNEEERDVLIDLPGHSLDIKLDGQMYTHGHTYQVRKSVYDTIVDVMARAWKHEDMVGGANRDAYAPVRAYEMNVAKGTVTTHRGAPVTFPGAKF